MEVWVMWDDLEVGEVWGRLAIPVSWEDEEGWGVWEVWEDDHRVDGGPGAIDRG